jgi:type I restriction enzyme R subunit
MKELALENEFIDKLVSLGFQRSNIKTYEGLKKNLKEKIYLLNKEKLKEPLSDNEFNKIYKYLMNGSRIEKANKLRSKYRLERDNGESVYIDFFKFSGVSESEEWCKNIFEVANQIEVEGKYKNRYDVTILINGLPLVQVELKRNGVELKEAFNQVKRYHLESYTESLFEYIQMFIISNKTDTKYFANNPSLSFDFTFNWSDEENRAYHNLFEFSDNFLKPCFLAKFIGEYVVVSEETNQIFILRPYQYYAVEKIIKQTKLFKDQKGGYIWHTTGSGKTLTSFKASQIISKMPEIDKVLFVVDRKDLDIQTIKEFKKFDASIEGTENTSTLIKQLKSDKKLIVTTIQKLSLAIKKDELKDIRDKKVVLIFDECHRNQFGKTNAEIKKFFKNSIMFGFTGTPIFEENKIDNSTTADIFGKALHKYVITDAIADGNVLGFMIEYFNTTDEEVTEKELVNEDRISKIVDKILKIHDTKTKHKKFNALLATASKEMAFAYYEAFKEKNHDLKIAVVFTYAPNEDIDPDTKEEDKRSKEMLEVAIKDYNKLFKTNFSGSEFYRYYIDLQKRIKNNELDIVIVVGMLLTGFDHKKLNTLYVDKNLKYHGLIQAFSRTNRVLDSSKPYGNIVAFRDLKENVDEALELFGNKEKNDIVLKRKYSEVKEDFVKLWRVFKEKFKTPTGVLNLKSEEEKVEFVKVFREILRLKSSLETYTDFSFDDVEVNEEEFFDYIGVYFDIYNESKVESEDSKIKEIDFSIELIRSDLINYDYIIKLLASLKEDTLIESDEYKKKKEELLKQLERDIRLRDKKELIEEFINNNLKQISKENIKEEFEKFWDEKKEEKLKTIAKEIDANFDKLKEFIKEYEFSSKFPKNDEIIKALNYKPKLLQRNKTAKKIKTQIVKFIEMFEW